MISACKAPLKFERMYGKLGIHILNSSAQKIWPCCEGHRRNVGLLNCMTIGMWAVRSMAWRLVCKKQLPILMLLNDIVTINVLVQTVPELLHWYCMVFICAGSIITSYPDRRKISKRLTPVQFLTCCYINSWLTINWKI